MHPGFQPFAMLRLCLSLPQDLGRFLMAETIILLVRQCIAVGVHRNSFPELCCIGFDPRRGDRVCHEEAALEHCPTRIPCGWVGRPTDFGPDNVSKRPL